MLGKAEGRPRPSFLSLGPYSFAFSECTALQVGQTEEASLEKTRVPSGSCPMVSYFCLMWLRRGLQQPRRPQAPTTPEYYGPFLPRRRKVWISLLKCRSEELASEAALLRVCLVHKWFLWTRLLGGLTGPLRLLFCFRGEADLEVSPH